MTTERRKAVRVRFAATLLSQLRPKDGTSPSDGALLNAADEAALDLLLTTDRRIRYQQNLAGRKIALVVLTGGHEMVAC